jgi:hypothetical protein
MGYINPKALLDAATALPIAVEAKLPVGAPKISTKLLEFNTNVVSKLPDFPMELPDLPAVPELPGLPGAPAALRRRYVTKAEVRPVPVRTAPAPARYTVTPLEQSYTQPIEGVVGTVTTRRGM